MLQKLLVGKQVLRHLVNQLLAESFSLPLNTIQELQIVECLREHNHCLLRLIALAEQLAELVLLNSDGWQALVGVELAIQIAKFSLKLEGGLPVWQLDRAVHSPLEDVPSQFVRKVL